MDNFRKRIHSAAQLYTAHFTMHRTPMLQTVSVKIYETLIDLASECTYNTDSMTIWFNPHYSVNAGPALDSVVQTRF